MLIQIKKFVYACLSLILAGLFQAAPLFSQEYNSAEYPENNQGIDSGADSQNGSSSQDDQNNEYDANGGNDENSNGNDNSGSDNQNDGSMQEDNGSM